MKLCSPMSGHAQWARDRATRTRVFAAISTASASRLLLRISRPRPLNERAGSGNPYFEADRNLRKNTGAGGRQVEGRFEVGTKE